MRITYHQHPGDPLFDAVVSETISPRQEKNLRKLAAYLNSLPKTYPHFNMSDYMRDEGEIFCGIRIATVIAEDTCGTSACACGHGPSAGIRAKEEEPWTNYQTRVFGLDDSTSNGPWDWCFSGMWRDHTPRGAAQRITLMLDTGEVPKSAKSQIKGRYPKSYTKVRVPRLKTLGLG